MQDQSSDQAMAIAGRILHAVRRNLVLIAVFVAVSSGASWLVLRHLPPVYTATAIVWLGGREADIIASESALSAVPARPRDTREEGRIMAAVLKSIPVLRRVVVSTSMHEQPDTFRPRLSSFIARLKEGTPWFDHVAAEGATPASEAREEQADEARLELAALSRRELVTNAVYTDDAAERAARIDGPRADDLRAEGAIRAAVANLAQNLRVDVDLRSEIAVIQYSGPDPLLAARIVNGVPDAFAEERRERLRSETRGAVDWLAARVDAVRQDLIASEKRLERFIAENGLDQQADEDGSGQSRLERYTQAIDRAREAEADARGRLEQAQAAMDRDSVDPTLFGSTMMERLVALRADTFARRRELLTRVGPDHALVANVKQKIAGLDADIEAEKRRILEKLEEDLVRAERELEVATQRLIDERQDILQQTGRKSGNSSALTELQREADANRALYANLLARLKEARQAAQFESNAVRLIQPALVPSSPSSLSPTVLVAAAGFGSLLFALTLVGGLTIIDRRIAFADQLSRFGFDAIVSAPTHPDEGVDRPRVGTPRRSAEVRHARVLFDEAIRRLMALTLYADGQRAPGGRVVMIASASKHEGKSTVARRLASYAAAAGTKTALVEADLRHPGQFSRVVDPRNVGLAGHLAGRAPMEAVLFQDPASGLAVVPATQTVQNSTDLIASRRMQALLDDLRTRFELIVVDTPPVCLTPDTEVLAPAADDIVFVVKYRETSIERTERALEFIDRAADRRVICLVNMTDSGFFSAYYGPGEHTYIATPYKRPSRWFPRGFLTRKTSGRKGV